MLAPTRTARPLRVHTSTPAPAAHPAATLTLSGRISHAPHVAVEPCDKTGQLRHVVVVELDHVGPAQQRLKALVDCDSHKAAEALAARLKRGTEVTVTNALSSIRMFLGAAALSIPAQE